jgi:hypothetical protein
VICPPCTTGGQLNALASDMIDGNPVKADMFGQARQAHNRCAYRVSCPCHHVVGRSVVPKDSEVPK